MKSKVILKIYGLAVFKGDKFVGELSSMQTVYHLILSNQLRSTIINVPSPFSDSAYISLSVTSAKCKSNVEIVNGSPFITCNVDFDTRVLSSSASANYLNDENIELIQTYANSFFKSHIEDYLYQTSINFGSDIVGFGKCAVKNFSTMEDWNNYNWLENYKHSFFDVTVNTHVASSYLIIGNNE